MIAEIGLAALWLAAGLCLLQFIAGAIGARGDEQGPVSALVRPAAIVQALLLVVSFVCLLWVFAVTDLSVALVAANSHADKPFIYRISGAWGNHEGSMLLWVTILGLCSALVALFEQRGEQRFIKAAMAAQGFVALGFYAFLLLSSNPFERLDHVVGCRAIGVIDLENVGEACRFSLLGQYRTAERFECFEPNGRLCPEPRGDGVSPREAGLGVPRS